MTSQEFSTKRYFHNRTRQLRELFPRPCVLSFINNIGALLRCGTVIFKIFHDYISQLISCGFILFAYMQSVYTSIYAAKPTSIGWIDSIKFVGAHDSFRGIKCNNPHHSPSKITNRRWTIAKVRVKFIFHRRWFVFARVRCVK